MSPCPAYPCGLLVLSPCDAHDSRIRTITCCMIPRARQLRGRVHYSLPDGQLTTVQSPGVGPRALCSTPLCVIARRDDPSLDWSGESGIAKIT